MTGNRKPDKCVEDNICHPKRSLRNRLGSLSSAVSSKKQTLIFTTLMLFSSVALAKSDKDLPKTFQRAPYSQMSLSVGSPTSGWQLRAKRLRSGSALKIKKGSDNHSYGHPALVLMLQRSAKDVASAAPGSIMLVGDLSSKNGGSLAGHRSHQSGRDADVGFYVRDKSGKPALLNHFVVFNAQGQATDGSGYTFDDERNWFLVRSWLRDKRAGLTHVFVSSPLRTRLLKFAAAHSEHKAYLTEATTLLKQPRNSAAHDDHFHVRISCPKNHESLCSEHARVSD